MFKLDLELLGQIQIEGSAKELLDDEKTMCFITLSNKSYLGEGGQYFPLETTYIVIFCTAPALTSFNTINGASV